MTEIEKYEAPGAVAAVPQAAHALVEWAQSADAAYTLANKLCGTSFVPAQFKGKPVEAAAAMIAGAEVGLSPMASLRAFDVIQGVAAPRALTLRAVAQAQGHEFIVEESTDARCVMRGRRRGASDWQRVEWTIQRATRLGLTTKDQWKKQPQTMLVARATSELVRMVAADAVLGIGYTAEEVADEQATTKPVSRESATKTTAQRKRAVAPDEPPLDDETPRGAAPSDVTEDVAASDVVEVEGEAVERAEHPSPAGITDKTRKRLFAMLHEQGIEDAEQQRAGMSAVLGRAVESRSSLTEDEGQALIVELEARKAAAS